MLDSQSIWNIVEYADRKCKIVEKKGKCEINFICSNSFEDPGESGMLISKRICVSVSEKRHTIRNSCGWHTVAS